jgi:hypothetical protein
MEWSGSNLGTVCLRNGGMDAQPRGRSHGRWGRGLLRPGCAAGVTPRVGGDGYSVEAGWLASGGAKGPRRDGRAADSSRATTGSADASTAMACVKG